MTAPTTPDADLRGRLFLKVSEVARVTEADPRTIRRAIELGQIEAVRLGDATLRIPAGPFWQLCGLDPQTLRPADDDGALDPEDESGAGPDQADPGSNVHRLGVRREQESHPPS